MGTKAPALIGRTCLPEGPVLNIIERAGLAVLHRMDPEVAHQWSLAALRSGLLPMPGPLTTSRLTTDFAGLRLPNPVGLAAGYDKNAEAVPALTRAGFGFLEVGATTPRPQPGNPRPRLFRLPEDCAAINRFGFNSDGAEAIAERLKERPRSVPIGLNLGANKDSVDRAADYAEVLRICGPNVDFTTVNVSSPNTEKLRELQGPTALAKLLSGVLAARSELPRPIPVFLKISPDLTSVELESLADVVLASKIDGVIATNTTLARKGLRSRHAAEAGGLSGAPLFLRSTRVLAQLSKLTHGAIPLIGVGGISSAQDAYDKITAGASAVQLYTAMVYEGLSLVPRIVRGLDRLLERDGFSKVSEAVGTRRENWL